MSGDYTGGFGGQRGNFNNQGIPMNQMGMNNPGQMMNFQQQQQQMLAINQMGGVGVLPDQQTMMGNPLPVVNPTGMHSPHHQQTQMVQPQQQQLMPNMNLGQNSMSLQTPTVPTAPIIEGGQQQHQQPPPQQQQQLQPVAAPGNPQTQQLGQPMNQSPFNPVTLCKFAQETVQEIVCRFQEIFQTLRVSAPPNGTNQGTTEKKVQEQLRTIRLLFKRIRLLYDRCNDGGQISMEYTQVESLIPLKDELDSRPEPPHGEEYKKAVQENRELLDQLTVKNKQLREVIDRLRIMIWEINTMLSMRRS